MAWEWVAPTATGIGTVVSTVAVALTARGGRRHAEQVAHDTAQAAERLAHQERADKDRAEAYVEALTLAGHFTLWSERISPALDTIPPIGDPPFPTDTDQIRVRALLGAHGTPEVNDAFEQLVTAVKNVKASVRLLRMRQVSVETSPPGTVDVMDAWNRLEDNARPAQTRALDVLTERIAAELRGLPPAPAASQDQSQPQC